jgi:hypothetical protein
MNATEMHARILTLSMLESERQSALQSYVAAEAIVEALFAVARFVGGKTRFAPQLKTQGATH